MDSSVLLGVAIAASGVTAMSVLLSSIGFCVVLRMRSNNVIFGWTFAVFVQIQAWGFVLVATDPCRFRETLFVFIVSFGMGLIPWSLASLNAVLETKFARNQPGFSRRGKYVMLAAIAVLLAGVFSANIATGGQWYAESAMALAIIALLPLGTIVIARCLSVRRFSTKLSDTVLPICFFFWFAHMLNRHVSSDVYSAIIGVFCFLPLFGFLRIVIPCMMRKDNGNPARLFFVSVWELKAVPSGIDCFLETIRDVGNIDQKQLALGLQQAWRQSEKWQKAKWDRVPEDLFRSWVMPHGQSPELAMKNILDEINARFGGFLARPTFVFKLQRRFMEVQDRCRDTPTAFLLHPEDQKTIESDSDSDNDTDDSGLRPALIAESRSSADADSESSAASPTEDIIYELDPASDCSE